MEFGDGALASTNFDPSDSVMSECVFGAGEYIQTVTVHTKTYGNGNALNPGGFTFVTNKQTCGPHGPTGGEIRTYSGNHRLLYLTGRCGAHCEKMDFVFDAC